MMLRFQLLIIFTGFYALSLFVKIYKFFIFVIFSILFVYALVCFPLQRAGLPASSSSESDVEDEPRVVPDSAEDSDFSENDSGESDGEESRSSSDISSDVPSSSDDDSSDIDGDGEELHRYTDSLTPEKIARIQQLEDEARQRVFIRFNYYPFSFKCISFRINLLN
jgi:hypothetical protein